MRKIKVILLEDIENLGKKYEIKEVKAGYAKNFLIPKKLVKLATKENMEWLERQLEREAKKAEEELKKVQEVASKIDGLELIFPVKIGEKGELFEKIGVSKILEELKEQGFHLKKNQILLEDSLKELGEFPVKIKFPHNLEAEIKVIITEKEK